MLVAVPISLLHLSPCLDADYCESMIFVADSCHYRAVLVMEVVAYGDLAEKTEMHACCGILDDL